MKNTITGLALLFQILLSISVNAQCTGYAGVDIEACGNTISLNGNEDTHYFNGFWSSTHSEIEISDINDSNTEVIFISDFDQAPTFSCNLVWNLVDLNMENCADTVHLIFKIIPSNNFSLDPAICSGDFVDLIYLNQNDTELPCPFLSDWNFDSNIILQATSDPCSLRVTAINTESEILVCPISLQYNYNGCISDFQEKELDVFYQGSYACCEEPTADAGEDKIYCGYTQTLNAQLSNPNNHGQWIFYSGPNVSLKNEEDWGSETMAGNPNAILTVEGPGIVFMKWIEWDGECNSVDFVELEFRHEGYCVGLYFNTNVNMPSSEIAQNGSIGIYTVYGEAPYEYHWTNIDDIDVPENSQIGLGVGLYSVLVKGINNEQSLRHIYLVPQYDEALLETPLNSYEASVESYLEVEDYQTEIYDFLILEEEILVQWKIYKSNTTLYFINVSYPNEYTVSGAYTFIITLDRIDGETITFESTQYLDFDIMTGVENGEGLIGKIYPNPSNGIVYIDSKDISELILTDITGRIISNTIQKDGQSNYEIDLSNEKPGIYLLHLKTNERQQIVKLIRE